MGKTLLELFKGSTQDKSVKPDKETLVEQELTGVRIKSAVEINNPLIYGNEATRIAQRSTPDLEKMKGSTGGKAGDGGLIGKGLSKLTGGKNGEPGSITSLGGLRDKVNDKLGIPKLLIPTEVVNKIVDGKSNKKGEGSLNDSQTPITQDLYGKNGSEEGKFLKQSAGNPKTILKQGAGKLIGKAKDKLRGALFGSPDTLGAATPAGPKVIEYTNEDKLTYSGQARDENRKSYSKKDDFKVGEGKDGKLDLSKVSPIYGVKRKDGLFGESEYGFINRKNPNGEQSLYNPEATGFSYNKQSKTTPLFSKFGLGPGDSINLLSPSDEYTLEKNAFAKQGDKVLEDFIPVWMKKMGSAKPIMFRALISGLTENVSPSWSTSKFVGNPYNFYTFDSIERSTSFNLKMYCNNSIELSNNWEKITKITQMTYPTIGAQFATAPIIEFRIGDIYNNKRGFIDSLTYSIPDESNWETEGDSGWLPKIIDVAISIKFIESTGAEDRPYSYTISKEAATAINEKRQASAAIEESKTESNGRPKIQSVSKITSSGAEKVEGAKLSASSKIPKNLAGKKQSTPADAEAAKLPDNANQGGTADKLDGKTAIAKKKELLNTKGLTEQQASTITVLFAEGYREHKDKKALAYFKDVTAGGTHTSFVVYYKKFGPQHQYKCIFNDGTSIQLFNAFSLKDYITW